MKNKLRISFFCALLFGFCNYLPAVKAAPGDLDVSFAGSGRLFDFFYVGGNDYSADAAVQSDGKLVVIGPSNFGGRTVCQVIRFNPDGSQDPFFGALIPLDDNDVCRSVEVQADGKIIILGDGILIRLNANGTLDTTFSGDGKVTVSVCGPLPTLALTIQPDGKYVISGYCGFFSNYWFATARYNTNGTIDTTFGTTGLVQEMTGSNSNSQDVIVQPDGKVVVVGGGSSDFKIVRYNANGTLDTSFDGDGIVFTSVTSGDDSASSVALQTDGKIVVGGFSAGGFTLVRYNTDGSLDTSFDTDGMVTTSAGSGVIDVRIQTDGKIVAVGNNGSNYVAARYNTDGSLDTSFDGDGISTTAFESPAHSAILQADNKLVMVGGTADFALMRLDTSGTLDTTFDGDGKIITNTSIRFSGAHAVAIQPDGGIITAGRTTDAFGSSPDFAIARYNTNGTNSWKATRSVAIGTDIARAVAIQGDGKVVVAGEAYPGPKYDFGLARLNADGSFDTSFGNNGTTRTPILSDDDYATSVAIQADGKIVVGGYSYNGTNNDFALARYNTNGSLDTSFDGDGKLTMALDGEDRINALAIQTDGKIVAAGFSDSTSTSNFILVRYNTDGTLDTSFDGDGISAPTGLPSRATALKIQTDGKLVAAGNANNDFAVVRYNANGSLDTSFDGDGKVTTSILTTDRATSIALQTNGKIVVGGSAYGSNSDNEDFALVRYNPDGSLDTTFSGDGKLSYDIFEQSDDVLNGIAIDSNGRIVAVGEMQGVTVIARFDGDAPIRSPFDFDGDGRTDISIFRPSTGDWWYQRSSDGQNRFFSFGTSTSKLAPADYTGDGKTDIAFHRPTPSTWFILRSENSATQLFAFGAPNDVPAPGDFDGDGKADAAVFRPSEGNWYIRRSTDEVTTVYNFGLSDDVPVVADYDGDGKSDIAIYRPSNGQWWITRSSNGSVYALQFGTSSDKPVPGDYTGDGKADNAVWRPSTGEWFVLRSEDYSYYAFPFGTSGDIPAPGDYDGDGKFDTAVFRPTNSTWYINRTTSGILIQTYGISGDKPVPSAFVP